MTIARAKNSRSPGASAISTSFARALNRGDGGGAFSFWAFWSRSFSFFCSSREASRPASGSVAFRPVRNIIRAGRSTPSVVLNRDVPNPRSARKAPLPFPFTNVRSKNAFMP